jgi:hypothetical protein
MLHGKGARRDGDGLAFDRRRPSSRPLLAFEASGLNATCFGPASGTVSRGAATIDCSLIFGGWIGSTATWSSTG